MISNVRVLACLTVLVLLGRADCLAAENEASRPPNIIYILADDLGYGDLSCYGQEKFSTPHIDQLAEKGIRFTQHYAGSSVCAPSRSTIMTGLHTGHTPIRGNAELQPEGQYPIPSTILTLPIYLKAKGYTTGVFGKWGLGSPDTEGEPTRQGFDRFYGYNCQRQAHHYYPHFLWSGRERLIMWHNFGLGRGEYAPDLIQEQALNFIQSSRNKPFFLYYAHIVPHAEMFATDEYMNQFRGKFGEEKPYRGVDQGAKFRKGAYGSQSEPRAAFAAMVTMLDDHVGQIVAKLEEQALTENTLIVFSSDNGPHSEGGHDPAFFDSSGGLRGRKRDLYEGGIRVPMIANWPGKIPAGTTTEHLSAQWDLFPTFAEVAGAPIENHLDGISFLPTLLGDEKQHQQHENLYWEFHESGGRQAVREGRWKAVRYQVSRDPDSTPELYDLKNDPAESSNVADAHPEVVARLQKVMSESRIDSDIPKFNFP